MILGTPRLRHHSVRVIADSDARSPRQSPFFLPLPSKLLCLSLYSKQAKVYRRVVCACDFLCCALCVRDGVLVVTRGKEGEGPRATSTFLLCLFQTLYHSVPAPVARVRV